MKYKKKPVVIEAVQWTRFNTKEIEDFFGADTSKLEVDPIKGYLYINTLEGRMRADDYDYIIRGIKGEYYPCKPDIFSATYEKVVD